MLDGSRIEPLLLFAGGRHQAYAKRSFVVQSVAWKT
jgi:hypothetical protein